MLKKTCFEYYEFIRKFNFIFKDNATKDIFWHLSFRWRIRPRIWRANFTAFQTELVKAPKNVRDYFKSLPMKYLERVEVDNDILTLATKYIEEKVVGQTSFDDCIHIATATIHKADILASWNFKHIVNIYRIRGYNSINLRMNYPSLEIRSPKEITEYED